MLSAQRRHQALFAIDRGIAVYERGPGGQWSEQQFIDSGGRVQRLVAQQGFDRALVVARSTRGPDHVVEVYEAGTGSTVSWSELELLEYPWVLDSERSNRNVEARLTAGGLVVATGTCLEHEDDGDDVTCARGGWRVFREADDFAMEEVFVQDVRSAAAPVLGADAEPYHLGEAWQAMSMQPAVGEVRDPAYHYDAVDPGQVGIFGHLITELDVRFPAPWSGQWSADPVESRTRFECSLGGRNKGFVELVCVVHIEDPNRPEEVARSFRRELDASMTVVEDASEQRFIAHVERTDGTTEVVIDDFQFFVDSPHTPAHGTARVSDYPRARASDVRIGRPELHADAPRQRPSFVLCVDDASRVRLGGGRVGNRRFPGLKWRCGGCWRPTDGPGERMCSFYLHAEVHAGETDELPGAHGGGERGGEFAGVLGRAGHGRGEPERACGQGGRGSSRRRAGSRHCGRSVMLWCPWARRCRRAKPESLR